MRLLSGQDLPDRAQLSVAGSQGGACRHLARHRIEHEERHQLKTQVRRHQQPGAARTELDRISDAEQHGLPENPGNPGGSTHTGSELHGDQGEQSALVAVAAKQYEGQGRRGGQGQQQQVGAAQVGSKHGTEQQEHGAPAPVSKSCGCVIDERGKPHHQPRHEADDADQSRLGHAATSGASMAPR
jgi:hypothetical protein